MKRTAINYTEEHLLFAKNNCMLTRSDLTKQFNNRFGTTLSQSNIASLCKRNQWLTGRTGRYEKGNTPHPNARPDGPNETSFKKGHMPANVKPLGHERICKKDGYILIKVAEENPYTKAQTRYRIKQHVVWEKHNGQLPKPKIDAYNESEKINRKTMTPPKIINIVDNFINTPPQIQFYLILKLLLFF